MNAIPTFCRKVLLYLPLALLVFLAGCAGAASEAVPSLNENPPAHPVTYRLLLPAQQKLRDISGDFSVSKRGADTGILILPGEKVEILASGSADIQPDKQPSGPDGILTCDTSAMPEPSLPCYSIIYSIGITGRAGEVGTHTDFSPTTIGNLFLGVNASNAVSDASTFLITVVVVPSGTVAGVWATPEDGFTVQGTTMSLSAYIFAQNVTIEDVEFTAAAAGQAPVSICQAYSNGGDTYSCQWIWAGHGYDYLHNGQFILGFTINGNTMSGKALTPTVNPDGTRTGNVRYVFQQPNTYYAGYAATALGQQQMTYQKVTGQWMVPQAHCTPDETSLSAVWVGITSDTTDNSLLAQLGTDSDCQAGTPRYYLWWEAFPDPSVPLDLPLQPGDRVTASVAFQHNIFYLRVDVPREGDHFSTTHPGQTSDTSVAECIVEAPTIIDNLATNIGHIAQLTDFGTVSVSCRLNQGKPIAEGPQNILYQMQTDGGTPKATTSPLDPAGTTFTVQWHHG